jgi:hypothetical protein
MRCGEAEGYPPLTKAQLAGLCILNTAHYRERGPMKGVWP